MNSQVGNISLVKMSSEKKTRHEELGCQRHLFALPSEPVYLSGASRSPLPRAVLQVGNRALRRKAENPWSIASEEYQHVDEKLRTQWATLLNAPGGADDLTFAPSCSYAISCAANNIYRAGIIARGDIILVLEDQMSSNVYPWQDLCERSGAKLGVVSNTKSRNGDWTHAILDAQWWGKFADDEAESCQVKVVAVPHVHWCDGSLLDLGAISKVCKERGAVLVVDATQSLGALPLDVSRVQADFVAAASHKWLLGPYGICLLYVERTWHDFSSFKSKATTRGDAPCQDSSSRRLIWPLEHHEHNRWNPKDIDCLPMSPEGFYETRYKIGARALDSGGRPNPVLMPMASKAMEIVLKWGPKRVFAHLKRHTDHIASAAEDLGLEVPSKRGGHIVGISRRGDKTWSDRCSSFLKENGVIVASRFGKLRVAPHVYNSEKDIDFFCSLLSKFVESEKLARL